ncbi:unnamed protein product [Dibothriocephalus latus]|uniref:Uncharacterized protein n=1 Tax=Dibothriocephalus latus TaxID=60516 RepID=A0A3P6PMG3_DIBLA|nr:unnamed protein product [Dibothriocephalus latus]
MCSPRCLFFTRPRLNTIGRTNIHHKAKYRSSALPAGPTSPREAESSSNDRGSGTFHTRLAIESKNYFNLGFYATSVFEWFDCNRFVVGFLASAGQDLSTEPFDYELLLIPSAAPK